ncbi:MAG: DUF456 domain-containing protein [Micrococcales bacterium]|nr:DUF456 domain-containing protein [Micrococcales bacterium]
MLTTVSVLAGLAILVGLAGIAIPVLPGLILIWGSVLVWSLAAQNAVSWAVLVISTALAIAGWLLQYLIPGRRLRDAGVPNRSTLIGLVAGMIGFFLIPVLGLPLGFVAGVYLAELTRIGHERAWASTRSAVAAAMVSYGIELTTGLLIAGAFVFGAWRVLF